MMVKDDHAPAPVAESGEKGGDMSKIDRMRFDSRSGDAILLAWILALALVAPASADPTIEITAVPPYAVDGFIEGEVTGVDFATHVVAVYIQIEGAGWWTKPSFAFPTVPIGVDGTFFADVATGGIDNRATIFCAALIPDDVTPPAVGGGSRIPADLAALAIDCHTRYGRTVDFAGYQWGVKEAPLPVGPGSMRFSYLPEDVWVDADGLHLTLNFHDGYWWATEVILLDSLGQGTYSFWTASELEDLDVNATFGAFTWDAHGDQETPLGDFSREIDFEDSRWGDPDDPTTSQMVVQPYTVPGSLERYTLPDLSLDPALTRFFTWQSDQVHFLALAGYHCPLDYPNPDVIHEWTFYDDPGSSHYVPDEGRETFRFNLWLNGAVPAGGQPIEVLIPDFTFTPLGATPPLALPGSDRTIDFGQSTSLGEMPPVSGGTGPYAYAWEVTAGSCDLSSDAAANPRLTAAGVGTCDAALVVTDGSRCESAAETVEIEVVCSSDLLIADEVIDAARDAVSLDRVTVERVTIEPGGSLEIAARGRVKIGNGTRVNAGGSLSVVIDPLADCP
jgi:hypothetical protein